MDEAQESPVPLSDEDRGCLAAVLDTLIPPRAERGLPGAGSIGLADVIVAAAPTLVPLLRTTCAALEAAAQERGVADFASLDASARGELLQARDEAEPGLIAGLLFQVYSAYYQHPEVMPALGLEARPPHPLGYDLEDGDLGALERVRARGRLYREA